jgi:YVTN family beta-propeller protein
MGARRIASWATHIEPSESPRSTPGGRPSRSAGPVAFGILAAVLVATLMVLGALPAGAIAGNRIAPPTTTPTPTPAPVAAAVQPATGHNPLGDIGTIGVGGLPQFAAYDAFHLDVYVPNWANSNVSVINGTAVTATLLAGFIPFSATYDPNNHFVYVVNEGSNNLTVFNGTSTVANIPVGTTPQFATFDSSNGWIYVSNSASANVSVVNGTHVIATINVGTDPSRVVVGSSGGGGGGGWVPSQVNAQTGGPNLYVPNSGSNNVSVIGGLTGKSVIASVNVGSDPQFATWDPNNVWLYVPNNHSGNVSILSSASPFHVLFTVAVGTNPWSATFVASTAQVLVVNFGSNSVSVLGGTQATTVVATITVGSGPEYLTQDPAAGGALIASNTGSNTVSVIVGDAVVGTIPAGGAPIFGTYDASDGFVYIQNFATANVTVLGPAFAVTFKAVGLPTGSPWGVHVGSPPAVRNNTTFGSAGTVVFSEPAGTINYSFAQPAGYAVERVTGPLFPTQTSASIVGPTVLTVRFALIETLTFNETGLAPGAVWGISIVSSFPHGGPNGQNATSNGTSIAFSVVGGPWKFSVTTKPTTVFAFPHKGTVGVPGHAVTKVIKFKLVGEKVVFKETGLTSGTRWGVNITGPVNLSLNGTTASIAVTLPNGTYSYSFWNFTALHPHPANGTIVVVAPHTAVPVAVQYTATPVAALPLAAGTFRLAASPLAGVTATRSA